MSKRLTGRIAIAAILLAPPPGYRLGAGNWPNPRTWTATSAPVAIAMPAAAPKERKVLYWKHPRQRHGIHAPRAEDNSG